MPSKLKRTLYNRKRELVKSGFKGHPHPSLGKNACIVPGNTIVPLWSRSDVNKRKKLHLLIKKGIFQKKPAAPKAEKPVVTKKFGKKGEERIVGQQLSKLLDPVKRLRGKKPKAKAPKVRASIQPGKVLILLAGTFAGKRVVCLKVLSSGLVLVTGPFKLNGVPLRRVNPAYLIATSVNVEIPKAVADKVATLTDADFAGQGKKPKSAKLADAEVVKKGEKKAKQENPEVENRTPERVKLQEELDEQLIASVQKVEFLAEYLKSRFTLSSGQFPHEMKF